ncbi:hypothetical protein IWX46DRAFT_151525 [Phyllosticta citricarpa]|uniref:Uncharacterized protein n=1 Tax=Phyllosticta citricarpa TaxID=55181 RepID=A0ABR1M724_9PEZI
MMYPPPPLGMAQASAIRRCQFLASLPPVLLCLSQIHPYKSKLPLHPPTAPAQELTMAPPPPPPFRSSSSTRDPHSASAPRPRGDLDQASIDPLNHIIYPPPPLPPPPPPAAAAPHPCPDAQDMSSLGYMMPTQYGSFTPSGTSFDPYGKLVPCNFFSKKFFLFFFFPPKKAIPRTSRNTPLPSNPPTPRAAVRPRLTCSPTLRLRS